MTIRQGWYPSQCRLARLCYVCSDKGECPDSLGRVHPGQMTLQLEGGDSMPNADEDRKAQYIDLDCPPGGIRPGDLIEGVMEGTPVPFDGREPVMKLFGNWRWTFFDIPAQQWQAAAPMFKERITALYNSGVIRYGSW